MQVEEFRAIDQDDRAGDNLSKGHRQEWHGRNEFSAHIAQTVEHFLGKEEVTGSSPVVGSTLYI